MITDRIPFTARPFVLFSFVGATYLWIADISRVGEARLIALLGRAISSSIVGHGEHASVLVRSETDLFAAEITRGCSAAVSTSVILGVGVLFTTGSARDRLAVSGNAMLFVFGLNLIRVTLIMALGARFGPEALAIAHDLIGTTISYLALAAGLAMLVRDSVRRQADPLVRLSPLRLT